MARLRSCRVCGSWHDVDDPWPRVCYGHFGWSEKDSKRSDVIGAPMIIQDGTAPFKSMADGMVYESKSAYRASLRNGETKFVELGSDAPATPSAPPRPIVDDSDIGEAIAKVKSGYKPRAASEDIPAETGWL